MIAKIEAEADKSWQFFDASIILFTDSKWEYINMYMCIFAGKGVNYSSFLTVLDLPPSFFVASLIILLNHMKFKNWKPELRM